MRKRFSCSRFPGCLKMSMSEEQTRSIIQHAKADLVLARLEVLLEGGSGGDGLAGILVLQGFGVAGVGHTAGADLGAVEDGGGNASSELGVEGGGASNKGSESNNLHGYRNLSKLKE